MHTSTLTNTINPLSDTRWRDFVEHHPMASVFHHPSWLQVLQKTYGFTPLAFTSASSGAPLVDGLVFCPLRSWLTGTRLVSLPFSDHCDMLADSTENREFLSVQLFRALHTTFRYAEVRSTYPYTGNPQNHWQSSTQFLHHSLTLRPSPDDIYRGFHQSCIQRKIRRAEREGLQYASGNSPYLLEHFYHLVLRTRRRHRIPPQPYRWFQNILSCMGVRATIHIAFHGKQPAAGMLTLAHQNTLTYKYGGSDERMNHLGGMPFLFWEVIQQAKSNGMETLDLGRSEADNQGLVTFKQHLGATPTPLYYWTYSPGAASASHRSSIINIARRVIPPMPASMLRLPKSILDLPGTLLYRHMD